MPEALESPGGGGKVILSSKKTERCKMSIKVVPKAGNFFFFRFWAFITSRVNSILGM